MATTLFFEGVLTAKPGAVSRIDASSLESSGLGASGIVAIVGTSRGGVPVSAMTSAQDLERLTRSRQVREVFEDGDLREACAMVFNPSLDPAILGGAQTVIPLRVDPATAASASFGTALGNALTLTTRDYGEQTDQTNASIAAGTTQGRLVTIAYEDTTEPFDNVGGDTMFTLTYLPPTGDGGWEQMSAQVMSAGVRAYGARTDTGLSADVVNPITAAAVVTATATAGDAGLTVTIYGLNASNSPVTETLTLINGTVTGTQTWNAVLGCRLSAAAAGTITIEDQTDTDDLLVLTVGELQQGLATVQAMYVANQSIVMAADAASTARIILRGRNNAGANQLEVVTLTGTTHVRTTNTWSQIDYIVLGDLAAARTLTITGIAGATSNSVQNTIRKVSDYYNGRVTSGGFGFEMELVTGRSTLDPALLDQTSGAGTNIYNTAPAFTANLNTIVEKLNAQSTLVEAERVTFVPQVRDLVITAANAATYTVTIDGTAVAYTSDGSATVAEIQSNLITAINNNATLLRLVNAATSGNNVRITGLTPAAYTLVTAATAGALTANVVTDVDGIGTLPDNTTAPVFLAGGSDGTASFSDWQAAFDLLKQVRVNTVVPLTGDPAVHAALSELCAFKGGPLGKSECDGIVGLSALDGNSAPTGELPSRTSIRSQIVDLNTRHLRACAQSIDRFDTFGERTTFSPWFQAVIAAGMQAGSPVGTSLTNKLMNVLAVNQDSTWNPIDDAEEMIQSGLCFAEEIDGIGRKWVRNVTTHLSSNNIAFVEASVNEAANYAAFELRREMERIVGQPGFARTVSAAKGGAINKLDRLTAEGIITGYSALSFELSIDVLEMTVQIAPVIPINFVPITMHLVASTITA